MVSFGAGGANGKRKTDGMGEGQTERLRESRGKGCRDSKGQQWHQKEWRMKRQR